MNAATEPRLAAIREKVENADLLSVLIHLARGQSKQAEPAIKTFAETTFKRLTEKPEQPLGSRYYYGDEGQNQPAPAPPTG